MTTVEACGAFNVSNDVAEGDWSVLGDHAGGPSYEKSAKLQKMPFRIFSATIGLLKCIDWDKT